MKKLSILGTVLLLFALAIPAMAGGELKPPSGEHFTFNTVTEFGPFMDTFDGDLSNWTNVSGTGSIVDDGGDNVYQRIGGSYVGATVALAGSGSWDDYSFEFDVKKVSGSYFNVVFRYVDQNNHYLLEPSSDQIHIALFKKVNGGGYQELTPTRPLQNTTPGIWYHYIIEVSGNSIKIYVDGVLMFDVTDTSLPTGKIGIGAYYGSVVHFDNILVVGPNVKVMGENEILVPKNGTGMLGFKEGQTFEILDNDMTDDGQAWVQVPQGLYDTYDQARGKPGGQLFWGNVAIRLTGKPQWEQHNNPLNWTLGQVGNWQFINNGTTCYSFRLYPIP